MGSGIFRGWRKQTWAKLQGIAPYQNAVLVDSSSRVLTLSENLHALLANGAAADDGLVSLTSPALAGQSGRHGRAKHERGLVKMSQRRKELRCEKTCGMPYCVPASILTAKLRTSRGQPRFTWDELHASLQPKSIALDSSLYKGDEIA